MCRLRLVVLLVVALNIPMLGQDATEMFGGYSLERIAAGCGVDYRCGNYDLGATGNLNGWITSITGYFNKSVGVTAQVSGNYGSEGFSGESTVHRYAYQLGPAYRFRWQRASAFGHALFGGVSQGVSQGSVNGSAPSFTAVLWSVGGGLDFRLSSRLSFRAAQVDYQRHNVPAEGVNSAGTFASARIATNGFRYSAGAVLRF